MKTVFSYVAVAFSFLFVACECGPAVKEEGMTGVWMLKRVVFPTGYSVSYPTDRGYTRCKIYDADSAFYHAEILSVDSETLIVTLEMERYTVINDVNDTLLVENGRFMTDFNFINDTMYTVYNNLEQELWVKVNEMSGNRADEIKFIISDNIVSSEDDARNFMFSTSERRLEEMNRNMLYVIMILSLLVVLFFIHIRNVIKKNRVIRRELELINEHNRLMPQPVAQAMRMVEQEFFLSDYYRNLRSRIENGDMLKREHWEELEQRLKPVNPHFTTRLYNLYNMSSHEYQVCLLLKINIPPKLIAGVLCKEVSSISSTSARLYAKVFGKKGGAKDWDAFVATLLGCVRTICEHEGALP